MEKVLMKLCIFGLSIITGLLLILTPIYKLDIDFIDSKLGNKVDEIIETNHPALYSHEFDGESFSYISNYNRVTLSEYSWTISDDGKNAVKETSTDGLTIHGNCNLSTIAIPDLANISIVVKTSNQAILKIIVDDNVLLNTNITTDLSTYSVDIESTSAEKLEIDISTEDDFTIKSITVNSEDYTYAEAKDLFIEQLLIGAGLIHTDPDIVGVDSIDMYNDYVDTEIASLKEGISFLTLYRMVVVDYGYNSSVWEASAGNSFGYRVNDLIANRHCPFIGIFVFVLITSILGGYIYIIVRYLVDLILKKESSFYIPAVIIMSATIVLLNISTFTTINFFDAGHNISTSWKLLFFECITNNAAYIIASILNIVIFVIAILPSIIDLIKTRKIESMKKFLTNTIILGISLILFIMGIIIR